MTTILRKLHWWATRRRREAELREELDFHLNEDVEEGRAEGCADGEARRIARINFGNRQLTAEDTRAVWEFPILAAVARDVRHSLRALRRTPGFTLTVVLMFALGIGANTAVFSLVDAVLLKPLAYARPDRLVVIHEATAQIRRAPVGATEFEAWRTSAQSFARMALLATAPVVLTGAGNPVRLDAARVSPSLFPMLGINAAIGRTFTEDEQTLGKHRVVLLSDGLWRTRFGASPAILGRAITLNDEPYIVTGVLSAPFRFPRLDSIFVMGISGGQPALWMPFAISDVERSENSFAALATLKDGVSVGEARAETTAIVSELAKGLPNPPRVSTEVIPLQDKITETSRVPLVLLWLAIVAVLAIACGNIASLLFARALVRRSELAIRAALGASHRVLVRHAVLEGFILAAVGGALGVLVAAWVLPVFIRFAPASMPRLGEVALNRHALIFAMLVTTTAGLAVGVLPARRAARTLVLETLRASNRTSSASQYDWRIRHLVVSVQVALTVVCLGVAGLVTESLFNVLRVNPGFTSERLLAVDVSLSPGRYASRDSRAVFAREARGRIAAAPGVQSVTFTNKLPFNGVSMSTMVVAEGLEEAAIPITERPQGDIRVVDPGYFRTLGIPLLNGSVFEEGDHRLIAVMSSSMATRLWPTAGPIGKRFRLSSQANQLVEVIGVVADVRNMGAEADPSQTIYLPYWQRAMNGLSFAIKTSLTPDAAVEAIRATIANIDPTVPVDSIRTMDSIVSQSVAGRTFQTTLLLIFGAVAVALAGTGIFGVMSYAVTQRSKELGVRLALGATSASVQRLVLRRALQLVGGGLIVGAPMAVAAGYALRGVLFGVNPQNPAIVAATAGTVIAVGLLAGLLPSRRAGRINPVEMLRAE